MPSNDTKIDDVGAPEKTRIKFPSIIDELFKSQIALIQHKILFKLFKGLKCIYNVR